MRQKEVEQKHLIELFGSPDTVVEILGVGDLIHGKAKINQLRHQYKNTKY